MSELSKLVIIVGFFVYVIHIKYTLSHNFILLKKKSFMYFATPDLSCRMWDLQLK